VRRNGGEVWIAGEQESINWLSLLSGATIDVDYSTVSDESVISDGSNPVLVAQLTPRCMDVIGFDTALALQFGPTHRDT